MIASKQSSATGEHDLPAATGLVLGATSCLSASWPALCAAHALELVSRGKRRLRSQRVKVLVICVPYPECLTPSYRARDGSCCHQGTARYR